MEGGPHLTNADVKVSACPEQMCDADRHRVDAAVS